MREIGIFRYTRVVDAASGLVVAGPWTTHNHMTQEGQLHWLRTLLHYGARYTRWYARLADWTPAKGSTYADIIGEPAYSTGYLYFELENTPDLGWPSPAIDPVTGDWTFTSRNLMFTCTAGSFQASHLLLTCGRSGDPLQNPPAGTLGELLHYAPISDGSVVVVNQGQALQTNYEISIGNG